MVVKEFKESNAFTFSEDFADALPEYCSEASCGFPLEMSEALTGLRCTNPKCPSKLVQRLLALLQAQGIKGMGETIAYRFLTERGFTNPLYIFGYEYEVDGALVEGTDGISKKISEQVQQKNTLTLAEYVKVANLPYVQSSAIAIFGEYDDLMEAYEAIEAGGIEFVAHKIGVSHTADSISIRAVRIYESLLLFKQDLVDAYPLVHIRKVNNKEMVTYKAVCSDEVGGVWRTKNDFYACCNNLSDNIHVDFGGSVTKATQVLVWQGADGSPARHTSKVSKAKALQAKYDEAEEAGTLKEGQKRIKIMTGYEFYSMLQQQAGI